MNLMCFESFKYVQTTSGGALLNLFETLVEECALKVLNLFETLADQHYKVVSDEFDVF